MERCAAKSLNLNPEKIRIKEPEIKFFGVICSADGVRPDPKKTAAISDMPAPTNRKELLSFLGLATYMGVFIPNLSEKTAVLRDLTKKNAIFEWNACHQQAFDLVKNAISAETTIRSYDPHRPITLQVDASMTGLGATFIQDGRPVAFASRALTETESRYAKVEPEVLAVIYGCERFHHFLFEQEVIVESDHKPLKSIHLKHLHSAPARLRRMLLRLQPCDIVIRICLDPKDLNKAIRRDYHVTPTLEEILPKYNGAKYFSILDAKSGYWNVELDEPSSYLTTFNSPFGRYRFLRMPFGLRMAQDVFQHRIDQLRFFLAAGLETICRDASTGSQRMISITSVCTSARRGRNAALTNM